MCLGTIRRRPRCFGHGIGSPPLPGDNALAVYYRMLRFTPMCRGQSHQLSCSGSRQSVHPQCPGTIPGGAGRAARLRFTPMCRDNGDSARSDPVSAVHPHVPGDNELFALRPPGVPRFTPMCLGTMSRRSTHRKQSTVHPQCRDNAKSGHGPGAASRFTPGAGGQ